MGEAPHEDASDRAPTLQEIKSLLFHCPLRLGPAVLMQTSNGFHEGALEFLNAGDVRDVGYGSGSLSIE
jgi:hypothetical protein